ncbi:putative nuclease HARBI1, partial [Aphis craccivora]
MFTKLMSHEKTELFVMLDSMGKALNNELRRKIVLIDIDSSDDEFDHEFINRLRGNREKPFRVQDFISQTIPNFTNKQFQQHFRLSPTSFERCLQICAPLLQKTSVEGRKGSDERLQLLSVIWLLATPDSFRFVGDRRIFTNSLIYERILQNKNRYAPGQYFIAADTAYPILEWCIPPYIDRGNLSEQEKFFNISLSRARQSIERCFALLKGRFRHLKYLDMKKVELVPQTIIACCVLHNICLQFDNNQWMNNLISNNNLILVTILLLSN